VNRVFDLTEDEQHVIEYALLLLGGKLKPDMAVVQHLGHERVLEILESLQNRIGSDGTYV
jgi:hypothetical protein